jgi:ribosomal protein L23
MRYAGAAVVRFTRGSQWVGKIPIKKRQCDGGNKVRTSMRVYAAVFVLSMMVSIGASAEPSRIDKSIYGFYLGESKESLLQRAKNEGIAYNRESNMSKQLFPDCYVFNSSLDKSKQVKFAVASFYKDHVGQVNVYLIDNSKRQFMQAAQGLEQSWNSFSGFSEQSFGPMYIITLPKVLVTLVDAEGQTYISYVHREMLRTFNEERNSGSRDH